MHLTRTFRIGRRHDVTFEFLDGDLTLRWSPELPAYFDQWTLEDLEIARAEFLGLLAATYGRVVVADLGWESDGHP